MPEALISKKVLLREILTNSDLPPYDFNIPRLLGAKYVLFVDGSKVLGVLAAFSTVLNMISGLFSNIILSC
jgi:hypothetical protein